MAAFSVGWQREADLIELDVQLTRDGHVVVVHDSSRRHVIPAGSETRRSRNFERWTPGAGIALSSAENVFPPSTKS
jgi:glycerophosphoryl diester phosphodiesterase